MGQDYPEWELRVCSEGSNKEREGEIIDSYESLDGRIKITYLDGNSTVPWALNTALSVARGEFVGLLAQGDELAPDALFEVVKLLQEHPEADLVYSDVDEIDGEGNRSNPYFKPGWSPDLLLSEDYISYLSVYRKSLLKDVGGFREGFDGCQAYDLVLRAVERTNAIHHVPKVLYHRAAPGLLASSGEDNNRVRDRARRALSEALERRGLEGSVQDGYLPNRFRAKLKITGEPKVSVIIPTRDNVPFLKRCIESVERLTTYRNYELLIVDNNSRDRETVEYLASIPHRVIPFRGEFNYSRINNFAVSQAEGEYILLLNDNIEVISGEWLEAMLEHAQRPEVGAVGAKLLYPDNRIQHAGVIVGVGHPWEPSVATHSYQYYYSGSPGYAGTLMTTINYSAVTAACMLLRKSLFDELGGLDEENLSIQFNDVDLCLRMREQGYYIIYTPYAELYHHESASRGQGSGFHAEHLYMRERWGEVIDRDPYYNPNFSRAYGDFNLRADLLRPKVLQQESDQTQEAPVSWYKNPLRYRRYRISRFRTARSSPRTTIIPKLAKGTAKASRQRQDELPQLVSSGATEPGVQKSLPRAEQLIWMFGHSR